MPLSPEQVKQLDAWMGRHRMHLTCQACGGRIWIPGEIIASALYSQGSGITAGGPVIPMLQLVCKECNHIMLFAAKPIFGMRSKPKNYH